MTFNCPRRIGPCLPRACRWPRFDAFTDSRQAPRCAPLAWFNVMHPFARVGFIIAHE
jgi:hypothetical protein